MSLNQRGSYSLIGVAICIVVGLLFLLAYSFGRWSREIDVYGREVITQAREGRFALAHDYLQRGGDPDIRDRSGFSLSFYAVSYGEHAILDELISSKADLREVPDGFEDLMLQAIANQDLTSVALLLSSGQWDESEPKVIEAYLHRAATHGDGFFKDVAIEVEKRRMLERP